VYARRYRLRVERKEVDRHLRREQVWVERHEFDRRVGRQWLWIECDDLDRGVRRQRLGFNDTRLMFNWSISSLLPRRNGRSVSRAASDRSEFEISSKHSFAAHLNRVSTRKWPSRSPVSQLKPGATLAVVRFRSGASGEKAVIPSQRRPRKNFLRSSASRSGTSMAGKWPPRSNSDQCSIYPSRFST
jgi:hypothetical protein